MTKKKTQGRKKIEIKIIDSISSRHVTFSKRRTGLFNKASELCVLTGAEAAIIVQSIGERVFAFGHPNVDSVVDQYLAGSSSKSTEKSQVNEFNINSTCMNDKFNQQYSEINKELEDEKSKKNVIENVIENKVEDGPFWWEQSFDDLGLEELENYIGSMEELKNKVVAKANEMMLIRTSSMLDVNQSSKNEGSDRLLVNENAGRRCEYGDDHMVSCPPGSIFESGKK